MEAKNEEKHFLTEWSKKDNGWDEKSKNESNHQHTGNDRTEPPPAHQQGHASDNAHHSRQSQSN